MVPDEMSVRPVVNSQVVRPVPRDSSSGGSTAQQPRAQPPTPDEEPEPTQNHNTDAEETQHLIDLRV